jgi:hypothetical protein
MAIKTLNTIKNWFRTGLKPTQTQFWDTWDSFRHKNEKVPIKDVEGIEELLNSKTNKSDFKTLNGESILGSGDISIDGGGSQDLQSVLDNGNLADGFIRLANSENYSTNLNSGHISITDGSTSANLDTSQIAVFGEVEGQRTSSFINLYGFNHQLTNLGLGLNCFSGLIMKTNPSPNAYFGSIKTDNVTSGFLTLQMPNKEGTYTLATLDDITGGSQDLQQTLENGTNADYGNSYIELMDGAIDNKSVSIVTGNGNIRSGLGLTNTSLSLDNGVQGGTAGGMAVDNGIFNLYQATTGGKLTRIHATTPTNVTNLHFPAKAIDGDYTLATLDDLGLPVSAIQSGVVNNISLQELGGVDKLINGVRIGRGSGLGEENTALGNSSLEINTGSYNTGAGHEALKNNTTGDSNSAFGDWSAYSNSTGQNNTTVGVKSLWSNVAGKGNTAIGSYALAVSLSDWSTAIGSTSLSKQTTGYGNTAIGSGSGASITSGIYNTSVGYLANGSTPSSIGGYNITMGYQAGRDLSTGSRNILIENITNASITTGSGNIVINPKQKAGINTGNYNTIIGGFDGFFSSNDSNLVVLGDGQSNVAIRKEADNRLLAPTLTNALINSGGNKSLITKEYLEEKYPVKDKQITILGNTTIQDSWNGQTILFTGSGTITAPATLPAEFSFNAITMPAVTIDWA